MHTALPPIHEVPAAHLEGRELGDGWRVTKLKERTPATTGGCFSIQYDATGPENRPGFLKALNFQPAFFGAGALVDRLAQFLDAYRFERDLLIACSSRRLSKVIQLISYGEVEVPEAGLIRQVPYLILEPADGDLNAYQAALASFDAAWMLRTMNHATLGIEQLHAANTAHQDLKPSNILTQQSGREMKIGDLGRAERRGVEGPVTEEPIPGALSYAPPEQLYSGFARTWEERRAADLYLLGSLAVQLILGSSMSALLQHEIEPEFRVTNWQGDFPSVIPYLVSAHARVIARFDLRSRELMPAAGIAIELVGAARELTTINPSERGHPKDRGVGHNPYSVRRYVSLFNRLAAAAELGLRR
jgi:serine/threonine protein kinase